MDKAEKVTIRLNADQVDALDFMVKHGQFKTRSDAVRAAIDIMTREPEGEAVSSGLIVDLPDVMIAMIDKLVDLGHFRSRDHGLFELVRNGLDSIDVEEVQLKQRRRLEILAEKKTSDILEDVYRDYVNQ
ncbi:MAG: ribbon-helix-helix protein, CopG family [Candidatus Thermoplasmatota archaeon]|nr:ribbon-helix-helix protein, CopG family [Candidatus Thermoplasmatota archaeon]